MGARGNRPEATAQTAKLPSLDAGRFIAALLVTLFHGTYTVINFGGRPPFDAALRAGHAGVEYFFVLSGFIIYYAHRRDLSRPATLPDYARKRATRILPILWLVLIGWGTLRVLLSGETTKEATGVTTILLDMLLLPHSGPLVLSVTWTLQRELVFYLLFAVALVHRRAGMIVLAAWQVAVLATAVIQPKLGPWGIALLDVYNLGFGLGLLIAIFGDRLRIARPLLVAGIGALLFMALLAIEWRIGGPLSSDYRPLGRWTSPILYTVAAGICLAGLVRYDQRHGGWESRLVATLGGSSYVLYLVHGPVGSLLVRVVRPLHLGPELLLLVLVAGSVAAAVAIHLWIEKPIMRALRPKRVSAAPLPVSR